MLRFPRDRGIMLAIAIAAVLRNEPCRMLGSPIRAVYT
jgi:hypothetical protein